MAIKGHKGEREERRYRSTVGSCFLGNDYLGNDQTKSTDQNHASENLHFIRGYKTLGAIFLTSLKQNVTSFGDGDVMVMSC